MVLSFQKVFFDNANSVFLSSTNRVEANVLDIVFRARFLISSKRVVAMDLTIWKCGGMSRIAYTYWELLSRMNKPSWNCGSSLFNVMARKHRHCVPLSVNQR